MTKILIIDDEEDIRNILTYNLKKEGFETMEASNGEDGLKIAKEFLPDLFIIDVMMPEMDGIEVCDLIRKDALLKNTLVCFLTARSEDYSQIAGLDAGADDYITKPIKPKVLISRINALIRRASNDPMIAATPVQEGIVINRDKYVVEKDGETFHLPRKEFELLSLLFSKPDTVFERETILDLIWGSEIVVGDRTIDVHIRKLREKLGNDTIKTVKGVGYKYVPQQ